jgi:hypothetical protein
MKKKLFVLLAFQRRILVDCKKKREKRDKQQRLRRQMSVEPMSFKDAIKRNIHTSTLLKIQPPRGISSRLLRHISAFVQRQRQKRTSIVREKEGEQ